MVERLRTVLVAAICFVMIVNLTLLGISIYTTHLPAVGKNTGEASFCINYPPVLNVSCNSTMSQGTTYE